MAPLFPDTSARSFLEAFRQDGRQGLFLLLDPDKLASAELPAQLEAAEAAGIDALLLGGSLMTAGDFDAKARAVKAASRLPLLLFPGAAYQLSAAADAILFLSLLSGRNPEYLISQHVVAAPQVRALGLEALPTAYLLVDGGRTTAAHYISATLPLPSDKPDIAAATALAGRYLGLRLTYLDTGSGAPQPVPPELIAAVRDVTEGPIVCGGGIRTPEAAQAAWQAGADAVVVGTAWEHTTDAERLRELAAARLAPST